jgi:TonB family protein
MTCWLSTLSASVPMVWPPDAGSTHVPIILAPNQEEAKRGKKGCRKPEYPSIAVRKEVTGVVTMAFLVDSNGRVRGARVVRSSGDTPSHKLLDATALAYIGDCEFRPGTFDGVTVQSWTKIQYVWKIE